MIKQKLDGRILIQIRLTPELYTAYKVARAGENLTVQDHLLAEVEKYVAKKSKRSGEIETTQI